MNSNIIEISKDTLDIIREHIGKKFMIMRSGDGLVLVGLDMDDLVIQLKSKVPVSYPRCYSAEGMCKHIGPDFKCVDIIKMGRCLERFRFSVEALPEQRVALSVQSTHPLCWICDNPLESIGQTGKYYCMECGEQQVPTEASAPEYYQKSDSMSDIKCELCGIGLANVDSARQHLQRVHGLPTPCLGSAPDKPDKEG